jgi:hypothetical protein
MRPAEWGRPPNFLLVDYYNSGDFPGSVFEVAAIHNNVTYNRRCCGQAETSAAVKDHLNYRAMISILIVVTFAAMF